jgi:hypothetical protein
VDEHTFTKEAEKLIQTSTRKFMDDNCFLGQERSFDGGIHAIRDHTNARSVL